MCFCCDTQREIPVERRLSKTENVENLIFSFAKTEFPWKSWVLRNLRSADVSRDSVEYFALRGQAQFVRSFANNAPPVARIKFRTRDRGHLCKYVEHEFALWYSTAGKNARVDEIEQAS